MSIKITVIGGASVYTPELVDGLISSGLPIRELALMDLYAERLKVVAGLARRMARNSGDPFPVTETTDRAAALADADYVICQIRVGGMAARALDEAIPPRYGVIGQETVGPGGISSAWRTIPVMLDIAADVERLCPAAWFINFTNPSGVVTEALLTQTRVKAIGLCNIPLDLQAGIAEICGEAVELDYFGINHLSWIRDARVRGESWMEDVLRAYTGLMAEGNDPLFDPDLLATLGMIPSYYLTYYYNRPRMLTDQLQGLQLRAERVVEIEAELLRLYADPATVAKPALLAERGGSRYSVAAAQLIAALHDDSGATQILNVANGSTFANLPPDTVIEVPCRVDARGVHPLPAAPIPLSALGLLETVKASERLTLAAALTGDHRTALQALMTHPLVPSFTAARSLLAALLAAHADYLPQFALEGEGHLS